MSKKGRRQKKTKQRDDLLILIGCDQKELAAVKFWASGQLENLGAGSSDYKTVDLLLRLPEEEEVRGSISSLAPADAQKEALSFAKQFLKKRRVLLGAPPGDDESLVVRRWGDTEPDPEFSADVTENPRKKSGKQKKKKADGDNAKPRPHGQQCYCMATEHELVGNCLNCGKIICLLEGYDPCSYCGTPLLVAGNAVQDSATLEALKRRDVLLEYEATKAERHSVIDDQADYFSTDSQWVSPEERQVLKKVEKDRRRAKKSRRVQISFDFAGRRVVVADTPNQQNVYEPFKLSDLVKKEQTKEAKPKPKIGAGTREPPVYVRSAKHLKTSNTHANTWTKFRKNTVKDDYFGVAEETQDEEQLSRVVGEGAFPLYSGVCVSQTLDSGLLSKICRALSKAGSNSIFCASADQVSVCKKEQMKAVLVADGMSYVSCDDGDEEDGLCGDAICLDFSGAPTQVTAEQKAQGVHSAAKLQADIVKRLVETTKGKWPFLLKPLAGDLLKPAAHLRKYYSELQQVVPKTVSFVLSTNQPGPLSALVETMFPKRPIVILDSSQVSELQAYRGATAMATTTSIKGTVAQYPDNMDSLLSMVWLHTLGDFLWDPFVFDPRTSLTIALRKVFSGSEQIPSDLEHLAAFVSPVDHIEETLAKKRLESKAHLKRIRDSVDRLMRNKLEFKFMEQLLAVAIRQEKLLELQNLIGRKGTESMTKKERKQAISRLKQELQ